MKLRCIACEALARSVYLSAALSPHIVDVELVERGLHNQPDNLRRYLQERINAAQSQNYDTVLLVYGLCGKATAGLTAGGIPLVIPKAHDCITLFLGSRERYKDQFENNPGTYWYAHDYIERDNGSGGSLSMGSDDGLTNLESEYLEYVEKYGRDNADYLMQVMGAWQKHYQRAVYIDMNIGDSSAVRQKAQQEAQRRGWAFEQVAGDLVLVRQLLDGVWAGTDHPDFLVVPPGSQVTMTYDEGVIGCVLLNS